MSKIPFTKYQGAGNDFIMIDDREGKWHQRITEAWVERVCDRRFGIGADGLILLQAGNNGADFFMKYYNADGRTSTFCGNGGRCIVSFASSLGIHHGETRFLGTDGWHNGWILQDGSVQISMLDVRKIEKLKDSTYVLFTGSPHYVTFVTQVDQIDVAVEGRQVRNNASFSAEGINVNFVELIEPGSIKIRTYERGVEDETYACGTGVVAAAIAQAVHTNDYSGKCKVRAVGGVLTVTYKRTGPDHFENVMLTGSAHEVFNGEIELPD
jgi:diaminopimelate epimerase